MYIFKKNMLHLYIKYIYMLYNLYEYLSICLSVYLSTYCMCVYLYIHNKYTQYTLIYYVSKNFYFEYDLIVWQHTFLGSWGPPLILYYIINYPEE